MALFWNEALYVTWPLEKGLFVPDQTVKMQDQEGKEGGDSLWCWPPRGGNVVGGLMTCHCLVAGMSDVTFQISTISAC